MGQVAGTAVAGPLGGIAASFVGDKLGTGAVKVGKRVFGRGRKPAEQAEAAPEAARPASADEPAAEPARIDPAPAREPAAAPATPVDAPS